MLGFMLRLVIALPLFAALLALSVLALALEAVAPGPGARPSPLHLFDTFIHRG